MSLTVLVCSWTLERAGRARALVNVLRRLDEAGLNVIHNTAIDSDPYIECAGVSTYRVAWREVDIERQVRRLVDVHNADAVLSWDDLLNDALGPLDCVTVGYLRVNEPTTDAVTEYWTATRGAAQRFEDTLDGIEVRHLNPVILDFEPPDPTTLRPLDERPIDVLFYGRRERGAVGSLDTTRLNILIAATLDRSDLRKAYRSSKLFLNPRPPFRQPGTAMAFEAGTFGCALAVPSNTGQAAQLPDEVVYGRPTYHVDEILDGIEPGEVRVRPLPDDRTDPAARLRELVGE